MLRSTPAQMFIEEFDLAYPAGATMGRALIRVFGGPAGRVVIATQPPSAEYDGPTINTAERELLAVLSHRFPGQFIFVQHYNRASQGLEFYEPTFNRVIFSWSKGRLIVAGWPAVSVEQMSQITGLTPQEVLWL